LKKNLIIFKKKNNIHFREFFLLNLKYWKFRKFLKTLFVEILQHLIKKLFEIKKIFFISFHSFLFQNDHFPNFRFSILENNRFSKGNRFKNYSFWNGRFQKLETNTSLVLTIRFFKEWMFWKIQNETTNDRFWKLCPSLFVHKYIFVF